jgi:hypothetical protein
MDPPNIKLFFVDPPSLQLISKRTTKYIIFSAGRGGRAYVVLVWVFKI